MNRGLILFVIGFLGFLPFLHAADLVLSPSAPAAWTVDISYKGEPSSHPNGTSTGAFPIRADITLVKDVRRTITTWSNGKQTVRWKLDSLKVNLLNSPFNDSIYVISDTDLWHLTFESIISDASSFQWVNPGMLTSNDPVSYQGKECFHYKGTIPLSALEPISAQVTASVLAEAWIEKDTLWPIALNTPSASYAFTYAPKPPTEPLVMPAKFQTELNRFIAVTTPPKRVGNAR